VERKAMREDPDSRGPEVAVVIPTRNRRPRLEALLAALATQTVPAESFEVIVVDDASGDGTAEYLRERASAVPFRLEPLVLARNEGRAAARERGWRSARAGLIAFVDDDCVPDPGWLEAALGAHRRLPEAILQGRTEPIAEELTSTGPLRTPFTRTIRVDALDPAFQTCNIFYPRQLLERIDGFDTDAFGLVHGGEDSDLAWRAIATGARAAFVSEALVAHAVNWQGPVGKLRFAASWELKAYARHPGLRRAHFTHRLFWKNSHYLFARAALAAALPRRLRFLAPWLVLPYVRDLLARGRVEGGGPLLAPYYVLHDAIEVITVLRAALRYRTPML
jgi:glycosyltransferase involved in cell wall biosynthesis